MTSPSCFLILFTVIQFTQHKIHPFKVYTSVGFSTFIKLCNHQPYLITDHFHHQKTNPIVISSHFLFPLPQPLATTNLLSVSGDLPILDIFIQMESHNV